MWDPGTAFLAVGVVAGAAVLAPPIARVAGGFCAVIGLFGVVQDRTWAPTIAVLGVLAWLVGHWVFAVRNDARYRSRLARALFDQTPLRWTLPQFWSARKRRRVTTGR